MRFVYIYTGLGCIVKFSFRKKDKGGGQNNTYRKFREVKELCATARPLGESGGMPLQKSFVVFSLRLSYDVYSLC